MAPNTEQATPILVTGSTGYVGGRLVPTLLEQGYSVRCLVREPRKLAARLWRDNLNVEIVQGDLGDSETLADQLRGCSIAYYLVHSMVVTGRKYAEQDDQLARNFAELSVTTFGTFLRELSSLSSH